jgi:hypothetical protein
MLAMGWAGESTASMELDPWLLKKMTNPDSEIQVFGANHDLKRENVLWNKELGRALILTSIALF